MHQDAYMRRRTRRHPKRNGVRMSCSPPCSEWCECLGGRCRLATFKPNAIRIRTRDGRHLRAPQRPELGLCWCYAAQVPPSRAVADRALGWRGQLRRLVSEVLQQLAFSEYEEGGLALVSSPSAPPEALTVTPKPLINKGTAAVRGRLNHATRAVASRSQ
jgi:hypothetical protein